MSQIFLERSLLWIVLLPLLGAIANGLAGRFASKRLVGAVAVGSVALSFVFAVIAFWDLASARIAGESAQPLMHEVYHWFSVEIGASEVPVRVAFVMDELSGVMTLVVTGIGLLIHIYSLEYMEDDPGFARFFTYLNLFTASMLILVLASNMPLMFVGWEGVGLCSYLLIGFWWETADYARAGKKAFIYNRVGDFGVLIAMFLLVTTVGSFEFTAINDAAQALSFRQFMLGREEIASIATVACLFLFLGCAGKSAQIPLYVWLPDAMAGPTPVSALIHAATMVTAGVYLVCRLSGLFIASPVALGVIAVIGALTALLAASIALVQNEIKKILAYSTVSQLGFMFAAAGSAAFAAAIFHVFTHAFFKACLFLGAGAVMHAVHAHGDADIRKLGGLKKYLPTVHWTFFVSCLAIAGVPLFSGFFSKDEILYGTILSQGVFGEEWAWLSWAVFGMLVAAATMTAFYMFRLYYLTFTGDYRSAGAPDAHAHAHADDHTYDPHPHAPGGRIGWPLVILGVGAIAAGYLGLPHALHSLGIHLPNLWAEWFEGSLRGVDADAVEGAGRGVFIAMTAGTLAMLVGWGLARGRYLNGSPRVDERFHQTAFGRLLMDKWRVDELYERTIIGGSRALARFAGNIDRFFVDFLLTRAVAIGVQVSGWALTRLQNGLVYVYGVVMLVGVLVVGWWFLYPHPDIEGIVGTQNQVRWIAGRGLGYEYRWDVDGNGELDDEGWSASADVTTTYEPDDFIGVALVFGGDRPTDRTFVHIDEGSTTLHESLLQRGWETDPEGDRVPPTVRWDPEQRKVILRVNDAHVRGPGEPVDGEVTLSPGDTVQIGNGFVRVAPVVRATVRVRNAFGNEMSDTEEVILEPPPTRQAMVVGGAQ